MTDNQENKDVLHVGGGDTVDQEAAKENTRRAIVKNLGEICEENKVTNALFLALDPSNEDEMIMYYKGNRITAGKMAAAFNKLVKQEILEELS